MKYQVYDKKYTYVDVRSGTKYPASTCTDADTEDRLTGEDLRFAIADGGDHTRSKKTVMQAKAIGTGRG